MAMTIKYKRLHISYPKPSQVIKQHGLVAFGTVPTKKGSIAGVLITKTGVVIPGRLLDGPPKWRIMFSKSPDGIPAGQYLLVVSHWLVKPQIALRTFAVKTTIMDDGDPIEILYPLEYDGTDDTAVCAGDVPVNGIAPNPCTNVTVTLTNLDPSGTSPPAQTVPVQCDISWSATFARVLADNYSISAVDAAGVVLPGYLSDACVVDCGDARPKKKLKKKR
jgi:hypothetical protein